MPYSFPFEPVIQLAIVLILVLSCTYIADVTYPAEPTRVFVDEVNTSFVGARS